LPTIIATHDITKGADHWLASTKREQALRAFGVTNIRTFVSPDDPTKVAVLMDVPDLEALKAGLGGPESVAAMENDGVVPETLRVLVEG
jgi:hypothetical protein